MPTNINVGQVGMPFALGKLMPGATYATVSIPLVTNYQPVNQDGTADNQWNNINLQADLNNSGTIYICNSAAAPDTTAYTNVIGELTAGAWFPRNKEWANNRDISKIFIGATNATDFVIGSIDAF